MPDEVITGGAIDGLKTIPSIPPISAKRNPMTKPPSDVTQLTRERTRMMTPHIVWDVGLEYIMNDPTMMTRPKISPSIPSTVTISPAFPVPVTLREEIRLPAKANTRPPSRMKMPPIRDRTIAAVGLSPKFESFHHSDHDI